MNLDDLPDDYHSIPLILTRAHGGPYEDDSFAAGFQVGSLAAGMQLVVNACVPLEAVVPRVLLRQLDLMAMSMELVMTVQDYGEEPDWAAVTFRRSRDRTPY